MLSALDAEGLCETDRGEPTIWKRKVVWPPRFISVTHCFGCPGASVKRVRSTLDEFVSLLCVYVGLSKCGKAIDLSRLYRDCTLSNDPNEAEKLNVQYMRNLSKHTRNRIVLWIFSLLHCLQNIRIVTIVSGLYHMSVSKIFSP